MSYKGLLPWQSEFSHIFACWAKNHRGWAKMKHLNRKIAKKRMRRAIRREIEEEWSIVTDGDYL